jgi:uncharacterized protein YkwD
MRKRISILVLVLLSLFLVACIPAPPDGSPYHGAFNKVNELRTGAGLPKLTYDLRLEKMAQDWSIWLCGTGIQHRNLSDVLDAPYGYWNGLGEVIAWSPGLSTEQAVNSWWFNSPTHHAVLVGNYHSIGFGRTTCASGMTYVVANLGRY